MEILRRMMAALLALVMVVTMLPVSALATETEPTTVETEPVETAPETTAPEIFLEETAEAVDAAATSGSCGENVTWSFDEATGTLTISGEGEILSQPWKSYKRDITKAIIQDGITSVATNAFNSCINLISVTIPSSVTAIGRGAFEGCHSLTEIIIPDGVTKIGAYAFEDCFDLTAINIPDGVSEVGEYAFADCHSLTEIVVPNGVTALERDTFYNCNSLTSVTIGDGVMSIGEYAFWGCSSLSGIIIPDSVTTIGDFAFTNCDNLIDVTIPDNVTSIGEKAFFDCAELSSVAIGDSVTSVGKSAFSQCRKLIEVTIGSSVTSIGQYAFQSCVSLPSVTIPDGVETIGGSAFADCNKLANVVISDSVKTIGSCAFSGCDRLKSIIIPDSVTTIGDSAFSLSGLTSVILGNGITTIGEDLFLSCSSLNNVTIPDSVTTIEYRAFKFCDSLTELTLGSGVASIEGEVFSNSGLSSIEFPESVTSIGPAAFRYCSGLTEVIIPDSVTYIGASAFRDCSNLQKVNLPKRLTSINSYTFGDCKNLTEVNIPRSVTEIGAFAFQGCSSLHSITIPGRVSCIESQTFLYCRNLINVTLPDSVTLIKDGAFGECDSLPEIKIPGRVTEIGDEAFWGCDNLATVYMGDSVERIYNGAFYKCPALSDVYYAGSEEQWSEIHDGKSNDDLFSATIHYNVPMSVEDIYHMEVTPDSNTFSIPSGTQLQFTCSLYCNDEPVAEWSNPSITSNSSETILLKGWEKVDGNWVLTIEGAEPGQLALEITEFQSGDIFSTIIDVQPTPVKEYINNKEIRINGAGSAFAYYQGDPNTTYHYTVNGEKDSVISDDKGIIRIMLGTYPSGGTYEHTVTFTHSDSAALSPAVRFTSTVITTELEYSYESQISLDASVGVKVDSGIGCSAGAGGGLGFATIITKTYEDGSCTVEIKDQAETDLYGNFKAGLSGKLGVVDLDLYSVSAKVTAATMGLDGFRIQDYSENDTEDLKALATCLLSAALEEKPDNLYLRAFQQWLLKKLSANPSVDSIQGSGVSASGVFEQSALNLTINDIPLITGLKAPIEMSTVITEQAYGSGDEVYSTAYTSEMDFASASVNVFGDILSAAYLGHDISVIVQKSNGQKKLETTALTADAVSVPRIVKGEKLSAQYDRYIFEDEALDELVKGNENIQDYLNGDRFLVGNAELEHVAQFLSSSEVPIEYESLEKNHTLSTFPLEFGFPWGVGMELGVTASYLQSVEYKTAGGYAVDDEILLTSESGSYTTVLDTLLFDFEEWIENAIASLEEDMSNFFTKVENAIQNGVETLWGWINGVPDSVSGMTVTLSCAASEEVWNISYEIGVQGNQVNFSLARQVANPAEAYVTRTAMTVGRPFIVNVTDGENGERITDFSEEPLSFTIRYAGEDLMAAGYDVETQVISMYRYSDDGDFFEFVGGLHDADAMTVTATITKPGQYVLAAEEMAEEDPGEDIHPYQLGDPTHDGSINAKDSTRILQYSVGALGEAILFCEDCAKVSDDDNINAKDSTLILQYTVGQRTEFPASSK